MIDLLFRKVPLAAEVDVGLWGAGRPPWETVAACWEGMAVTRAGGKLVALWWACGAWWGAGPL